MSYMLYYNLLYIYVFYDKVIQLIIKKLTMIIKELIMERSRKNILGNAKVI